MPAASDEQVPKPLTYTLMYHFLWCLLFWLSALTLFLLFLGANRPDWGAALTFGPPAALGVLGLIAGLGAFATYVVRVQLLLGEITKEDGFRWSSRSSWAVIGLAPVLFAVWKLAAEPLARAHWGGQEAGWPVPVEMTIAVTQVEVVVWWLSHLLSVRGLARGRKRYLGAALAT
ncbi:MAG TPA: hypothetical protein VFX49_03330 [Chloroflexota bacterium]|nr:hypothetical protein [Chloroflexota bacterium]